MGSLHGQEGEEAAARLTIKTQGLNDRQREVVATMRMRLSRKEALAYLRGVGYPMSEGTLGRIKAFLKKSEMARLVFISQIGFREQHLARLDNCEYIERLMWQNYHLEKSYYKKVMILKEIKELQPYISAYYDTTRGALEHASARTGQSGYRVPEYATGTAAPRTEPPIE